MTERYQIVTRESVDKMMETFCDTEEVAQFESHLLSLCAQVLDIYSLAESVDREKSPEIIENLTKGMIGAFGMFCRLNIETIHDFVRLIEFRDISEEELEKLKKNEQQ